MSTVNRELLLKVKEKILAEPAQFEMEWLFKSQEEFDNQSSANKLYTPVDVKRVVPNCGTAACIAGWVVAIHFAESPEKAREKYSYACPARLLGLRLADGDSDLSRYHSLCYVGGWPAKQRLAWGATNDLTERAKLAAEVIDIRLAEWAAEDATTEEEK